jgi:hypothetical protein
VAGYRLIVGTAPGASNVFSGFVTGSACTVTNAVGAMLYAQVWTRNLAGVESGFVSSPGTQLLAPSDDTDSDGMSNSAEDFAGTDPLEASSVLRILSLRSGNLLTWSSVSGKSYQVLAAPSLAGGLTPCSPVLSATSNTTIYLDVSATSQTRFYRVQVISP